MHSTVTQLARMRMNIQTGIYAFTVVYYFSYLCFASSARAIATGPFGAKSGPIVGPRLHSEISEPPVLPVTTDSDYNPQAMLSELKSARISMSTLPLSQLPLLFIIRVLMS